MPLHRFAALVLLTVACQPSVPSQSPPGSVNYAVSFPDASDGTQAFSPPTPNDLVLEQAAALTPTAAVPAAQIALLNAFARGQGWPNDQEVPIQIQFFAVKVDPNGGNPTPTAFPSIDTTTLTTSTLALLRYDASLAAPEPVAFEVAASDYDAATGVLTIHKAADPQTGSRNWASGPGAARYVVALRGGPNGVKTTDGQLIAPQVSTLLLSLDKDLRQPENQGLLRDLPNPAAVGAQLESLRQLYASPFAWSETASGWTPIPASSGLSAFAAVDTVFSHHEIATVQTFVVDPSPHVGLDPTAGVVPLPSEYLMNAATYYTAAGGSPFASTVSVPAIGVLAPLAAGLNTLDGFGTTPMILVPTVGPTPIAAASVTSASVVLLEKKQGGSWTKLTDFTATTPQGTYLTLPPPVTIDTATGLPCSQPYGATCVAELIGLQPAVGVPGGPGGNIIPLPPLDEHAEYAVIVKAGVKDLAGNALTPGTLAKVFSIGASGVPLVANGHSQLAGVSDAEAAQLAALAPLIGNELATDVIPGALAAGAMASPTDFVTAYTFVTQSITALASELVAATASLPASLLGVSALMTPDQTATKYGLPREALQNPSTGTFVPAGFLEATLVTLDVLDPATGAFYANPASAQPSPIPVLIAVPQGAGPFPLAIFRHGLGRGRADMLSLAATFTGAGMVVAAIDAAKCGDRAWCTTDADCATGSSCNQGAFGNQGDPANATPGLCTNGLAYNPLDAALPACTTTVTTDCWNGSGGIAKSSGAFFVSANLFRLRDTMRQDIVDEAALARAVLGTSLGVTLDSSKVFFVSQSLGSINGMVDLAVTPAYKGAVLNAGGGTFVDIASDSPAFKNLLDSLVQGLGITPGSSAYLQFLQVAKWVIDPADPVNFASTLVKRGIPILGQAARCDNTVPNTENELFYGLLGLLPTNPVGAQANSTMQWYMQDDTTACPADGSTGQGATHGFLLDFANASLTEKAQTNAATFLLTGAGATTPVTP